MKPYPHRLNFDYRPLPETQDGKYGAVQPAWGFAFKAWGDFEPVGGREFPVTARQVAEATGRFRVRFRATLLGANVVTQYRIRYINKTWNVHASYQRDGQNNEVYLEASEVK